MTLTRQLARLGVTASALLLLQLAPTQGSAMAQECPTPTPAASSTASPSPSPSDGCPTPQPTVVNDTAYGNYNPVAASRQLDTRIGVGAPRSALASGDAIVLRVSGVGGVPTSISAAVLNLTILPTTPSAGYVVAFPGGSEPKVASAHYSGRVIAHQVVSETSPDGSITLRNRGGPVHLVGDFVGYYFPSQVGRGGLTMSAVVPRRIADARTRIGGTSLPLGAGETRTFRVDEQDASVAVVVLTAVAGTNIGPLDSTHLTAFESARTSPPGVSSLNAYGSPIANTLFVPLTNGEFKVFNARGTYHVVVDLLGAFLPRTYPYWTGAPSFRPAAGRLVDTRTGLGAQRAFLVSGQSLRFRIVGGAVPAATAALLNVTAVPCCSSIDGYLSVRDPVTETPRTSVLNYRFEPAISNLALVRVHSDGTATLTNRVGRTHLVVDVVGYV